MLAFEWKRIKGFSSIFSRQYDVLSVGIGMFPVITCYCDQFERCTEAQRIFKVKDPSYQTQKEKVFSEL